MKCLILTYISHTIVKRKGEGEEKLTADAVDNPAIRQNIFAAQRKKRRIASVHRFGSSKP